MEQKKEKPDSFTEHKTGTPADDKKYANLSHDRNVMRINKPTTMKVRKKKGEIVYPPEEPNI